MKLFNNFNCGIIDIAPAVIFAKGEQKAIYNIVTNSKNELTHIFTKTESFKDDIYFNMVDGAIVCRRVVQNISADTLKLKELSFCVDGINFGGKLEEDYFYHAENPRIYENMTFPIDYIIASDDIKNSKFDIVANNRWADPGVITDRIGASPYQPFPAILISNYKSMNGLVHGTLNQDVFYHNYLVSHNHGNIKLQIFSSFKCVDYLEVSSGQILIDEWYLGKTENADNIEKIFEDYTKVLRKKLPVNYGSTNINRDNMVWGSWNDGINRNISEEMLLKEATFLKENFPIVKWIQLDDGYAKGNTESPNELITDEEYAKYNTEAHGLGAPYEGEEGIDYNKFPFGLRHFTDKLRELGMRPALWIGGVCPVKTKIYKENPDWFFDYSLRMQNMQPLDVSIPKVREYMLKAIDILCKDYGFDSVKHDFWSYAFEDSHNLYKFKTNSGYQNRKWWLSEIRKRIASDGYLQTGCDIVMGNPFLGEYFTNYRYGIDIGSGEWSNVKTNFLWGVACFATHTGDLFAPNSDAVGMLPGLNDTDAEFCINYCLVTHSMVEIAGKLSQADKKSKRFKMLQKATCNVNNGQDVYFVGYDYRNRKYTVPQIMYFNSAHFSQSVNHCLPIKTVGLFNIDDCVKNISLNTADLQLEEDTYTLADVWSGEVFEFDNTIEFTLQPHASRLLAVNKTKGAQLLDANIKLGDFFIFDNCIECQTYYKASIELLFNKIPTKIVFDGTELEFEIVNKKVIATTPCEGRLKIFF